MELKQVFTAVFLLVACCAWASAQCDWRWMDHSIGPPHRHDHQIVYDAARGQLVMFGGRPRNSAGGSFGSTWTRAPGEDWRLVSEIGPLSRDTHAMAYDPVRQRVVLFGGFHWLGSGNARGDTWEWDGVTWVQVASSGPIARWGAAMVFDEARGHMVLFGGTTGNSPLQDTWAWNGSQWTQLATSGPARRHNFGMAYDPIGQRVVISGGYHYQNSVTYSDTWVWNGTNWSQLAAGGPGTHSGHSLVYHPVRQKIVMLKAASPLAPAPGQMWELDGNTWTQLPDIQPAMRRWSAVVYDGAREVLVLDGGETHSGSSNETWEWNGADWMLATDPWPKARRAGAGAYDEARQRFVLFGGETGTTWVAPAVLGDTWEWDGERWMQRVVTAGPSSRSFSSAAYDTIRQRTVLFGGWNGTVNSGETWEWDGDQWHARTPAVAPAPRRDHRMVFDQSRGRTVLFGGRGNSGLLNDTWEWDGSAWHQIIAPGPIAREAPMMAYDVQRAKVVLYAGLAGSTYLNDVWEWDGISWTEVQPLGILPQPRYAGLMSWDGNSQRPIMMGGRGHLNLIGAWEWQGSYWESAWYPEVHRSYAQIFFDSSRQRLTVVGGAVSGGVSFNFPSVLSLATTSPVILQQPQDQRVEQGRLVSLTVYASVVASPSFLWSRNGSPLQDGPTPWGSTIVGSGTWLLSIRNAQPQDAGEYSVRITDACSDVSSAPAVLTVVSACYANCDESTTQPVLNVDDFTCFINRYAAATSLPHEQQVGHYANCDGSQVAPVLNVDDFTCFINQFAAGCP